MQLRRTLGSLTLFLSSALVGASFASSARLYLGAIGVPAVIGVAVAAGVFFFLRYFLCAGDNTSSILGIRSGWTVAVLPALCGIGAAIDALCFRNGPVHAAEAVALVFAETCLIALAAVFVLAARRFRGGPPDPGAEADRDA